MKDHWSTFARYNAWANARLYAAAAELNDLDYRADRGAFFRSVHGTLNHLLVADRIWMQRFTGTGEAPTRLDATLFDTFADLRAARISEDARIVAWIEGLDDAAFVSSFRYRRISSSEEFEQALGPALAHFFNHQTHHRGQAHGLLTAICGRAPELDLLFFQREAGLGAKAVG
jgi:uncharacterized damage-inducible protein DinB